MMLFGMPVTDTLGNRDARLRDGAGSSVPRERSLYVS